MGDESIVDEVTRAIMLAEAARRATRMEARKVTIKQKHWAHRAKRAVLERSKATRAEMAKTDAPKGRWGETDRDRAMLALADGEWLAHSDIGKRAGMTTQEAQWQMRKALNLGLVERAENEDYAGKPRPGGPVKEQPKFLWRITRAGEGAVAEIRERMGEAKANIDLPALRARQRLQGRK